LVLCFWRFAREFGHHEPCHKPDKNGEGNENDFGHGNLPEVEVQGDLLHILEQENEEQKANDQADDDFRVLQGFSLPRMLIGLKAIILLFDAGMQPAATSVLENAAAAGERVFLSTEKGTWYKRNGSDGEDRAQGQAVWLSDKGEPAHGRRGHLEASH
jgi:hypothetical protein